MTDLAWNGVGLRAPDAWEPASLERDGLLLECGGRPACELKWNVVQGTFSFARHMKRLSRRNRDADILPVDPADTPPAWASAVGGLEDSGLALRSFLWRAGDERGLGAALHHPATGLAALVQFFVRTPEDEDLAATVLASFRDHSGGKTVPWAMFGLAARVPARFRLETFSFKPGRFTVQYWRTRSMRRQDRLPAGKGPGVRLTFERFVPADALLRGRDLADWSREILDLPKRPVPEATPDGLAWAGVSRTSLLRRLLRREIRARGVVRLAGKNAILAVTATGSDPVDAAEFDTVVQSYGIV
ncbi:hypothetical protein [Pseudodesulfovibrio sp.]|uniref:hypothetical protein n=1 Tax=Pseudodesulfovibrio sp. TaxID=2035812 RepID=UPI00261AFA87|nr:hypothetical protein [Pseudodesulfovibrio sp.]MDD3312927.1 hypothetical protein [Pseudodesulfovibrio sp.]